MAIEWADNFSMYGTGSAGLARLTNGVYAETGGSTGNNLVADPDPNETGTVLRMNNSVSALLRKIFKSFGKTFGVGFRYWPEAIPTGRYVHSISFRDNTNATLITIFINTAGQIAAYRGTPNSGTLLGITTGPVVVANSWQHIEVKVFSDLTLGTVEVRVEGVTVLDLSNLNTTGTDITQTAFAHGDTMTGTTTSTHWYLKDIVYWNTSGAYNTNFLGSVGVYTLLPDSDVALNWVPSTGTTGYQILDNSPPVDTQYISADDAPPAPYEASLTNLPPDLTSIKGVVTVVRAHKVDGGDANLQVGISGLTDTDLGADRPMTTSFTYYADVFEENPDTSAPWLPSEVDTATLQLNRTV